MQNSSKTRTWANDDAIPQPLEEPAPAINPPTQGVSAAEELPSQPKKVRIQEPLVGGNNEHLQPMVVDRSGEDEAEDTSAQEDAEAAVEAGPVSDADWLRSKTSRLLGLLDEDEQAEFEQQKFEEPTESPLRSNDESRNAAIEHIEPQTATNDDDAAQTTPEEDQNIDLIRESTRLFVRNLAYDTTEADLQPLFAPFGKTEEVGAPLPSFPFPHHKCWHVFPRMHRLSARMMSFLIGTSDANADDVNRSRDFSRCFLFI